MVKKLKYCAFLSLIILFTEIYAENNYLSNPENLWIACQDYLDLQNKILYYKKTGIQKNISYLERENAGMCIGYIIGVVDSNFYLLSDLTEDQVAREYVEYINKHPKLQTDSGKTQNFTSAFMLINKIIRNSKNSKCLTDDGYVLCNSLPSHSILKN